MFESFYIKKKSFDLKGIDKGHYNVEYRGVPCVKCPFDYVIYQMIINEVKPDLIIEIGTNFGGSTLYLADLLTLIGNGVIHSVDIIDKCSDIVKNHPRISLFFNGWTEYDLNLIKSYEKVLVIEDSSHGFTNTLGVLNKFKDVVTLNSYFIIEDGIIDDLGRTKEFKGGPRKALKVFLQNNSEFILEEKWINFFGKNATYNPLGYLKKIK